MAISNPTPDMRDLMAAVGEVLLCWGYVESAILDRLAEISGTRFKPSKTSPLARWKLAERDSPEVTELLAEVKRLACVRNCLAHGLTSATADPKDILGAAVVCRTPSGLQRIAFETLVETRRALRRLSHAIRTLPADDNIPAG